MRSFLISIYFIFSFTIVQGQSNFDLLNDLEKEIGNRIRIGNKLDSLRVSAEAQLDSLMILSIVEYLNYNKLLYKSDLKLADFSETLNKKDLYKDLDAIVSSEGIKLGKRTYFSNIYLNVNSKIFPINKNTNSLELLFSNETHFFIESKIIFYDRTNKVVSYVECDFKPFGNDVLEFSLDSINQSVRVEIWSSYWNQNQEHLIVKNILKLNLNDELYDQRIKTEFASSKYGKVNQSFTKDTKIELMKIKEETLK